MTEITVEQILRDIAASRGYVSSMNEDWLYVHPNGFGRGPVCEHRATPEAGDRPQATEVNGRYAMIFNIVGAAGTPVTVDYQFRVARCPACGTHFWTVIRNEISSTPMEIAP